MGCPEHEEMKEDISNLNNSLNEFQNSITRLSVSIEKLGETTVSLQKYYDQNQKLLDNISEMRMDISKHKTWLKVFAVVGIVMFSILLGLHGLSLPQLL